MSFGINRGSIPRRHLPVNIRQENKMERKFWKNNEAVSPVIAVILMVAITVVLAATVFVLVSDIGGNVQSNAPAVSWDHDETNDRLRVTSSAPDADWNRLEISADKAGLKFALNFEAGSGNASIGTSFTDITTTTNAMGAGEYLDLCGTAVDVTITIRDVSANSVVGSWKYLNAAACA